MRSKFRSVLVALVAMFVVGAIASTSASAFSKPVWEVCSTENPGTGIKYEDSQCAKESGTGEFAWAPVTKELKLTSAGGHQEIVVSTTPTTSIVTCEKVEGTGNIKPNGKGEIANLLYTGCKINITGCAIVKTKGQPNGTIDISALKSTVTSAGDEITPASGSTFATVEIGKKEKENGEAEKACGVLETKDQLNGTIVAVVEGETLNFKGGGALTLKGIKSEYLGKVTQKLENGSAFRESTPVWEGCLNEKSGTHTKYEDSKCTKKSGTGTFEWMPIEKSLPYTAEGGAQMFKTSAGVVIECSGVAAAGNIQPGGRGLTTSITYHGCTLAGCPIVKSHGQENNIIKIVKLSSALGREEIEGKSVLEDEITPEVGSLFVTVELGKKEKANGEVEGSCGALEAKEELKGTILATVEGESLVFEGRGTLTLGSFPTSYRGTVAQKLESGNAFRAG